MENDSNELPPLSEADLVRSAKATREVTNRLGMLLRDMQRETFRRALEREQEAENVALAESRRTTLRSRIISLLGRPHLTLQPIPSLGKRENEDDVRELFLPDVFDIPASELEQQLPWCGLNLWIARTFTRSKKHGNKPVYSVRAKEPNTAAGQTDSNALVITLEGPNHERATAHLTADQTAALFDDENLPTDLDSLTIQLSIEQE
jgi:hypothetical protein